VLDREMRIVRSAILGTLTPGIRVCFQGKVYALRAGDVAGTMTVADTGMVACRVDETYVRRAPSMVDLSLRDSRGAVSVISGTPDHPFYVPAQYAYVDMGTLVPGTRLQTEDGTEATVVASTTRKGTTTVYNLKVAEAHDYYVSAPGGGPWVLVHNANYILGPNDLDWRGSGKSANDALVEAFNRTGHPREEFSVTKWGRDAYGKSHPVEWRHKSGAEVSIDWPHAKNGPDLPHVGWQTGGKRSLGGLRGHIIIDNVPYNR